MTERMTPEHFAACKRRADAANAAGRAYALKVGGRWGEGIVPGHCMPDGGPCTACRDEVEAERAKGC